MVFLTLTTCELLEFVGDDAVAPVLSELSIPSAVYLRSDIPYPVSVRAEDPQGLETVQRVILRVLPEDGGAAMLEANMADDGLAGDILPDDGVYFFGLTPTVFGGAGRVRVVVSAEDEDGHSSETLTDTLEVVDEEINLPPTVANAVVPDSLDEATVRDVFLSVEADDPQSLADIDSAFFRVYLPFQASPSFESRLFDDGTHGDAIGSDGTFSFRGDLYDELTVRGDYLLSFHAVDRGGMTSQTLVAGFFMDAENRPPVLSNLSAPDTVSRIQVVSFLITVEADDPQGHADIRIVFFNTIKPDGTLSGGSPFEMKDDGTGGDAVAGDGVYSLRVEITPGNELGVYRFEFFAEDYSGARSEALIHTITVTD